MDRAQIVGWKVRDSVVGRQARLVGTAPESWVVVTLGDGSTVVGQ